MSTPTYTQTVPRSVRPRYRFRLFRELLAQLTGRTSSFVARLKLSEQVLRWLEWNSGNENHAFVLDRAVRMLPIRMQIRLYRRLQTEGRSHIHGTDVWNAIWRYPLN